MATKDELIPLRHRLKSRTWWAVFVLSQEAFYLALRNNWSPEGLALLWGVLLSIWVGNKTLPQMVKKNSDVTAIQGG